MTKPTSGIAVLVFASLLWRIQATSIACESDDECSNKLLEGSQCMVDGFCSNPFHHEGCLARMKPDWHKIRSCHSDDPPEARQLGHCRQAPLDFTEIRALAQDWDTGIISTWVLQIILSEILDVPATVETSHFGLVADFYDVHSKMDYGAASVDYSELDTARKVEDCRSVKTDNPDDYQGCAHVCTEAWMAEYSNTEVLGIEPQQDLGAFGEQYWWVPLFTVKRDPTLATFVGLGGEENRRKLAERFKRPTTWKQYCEEVSEDGCQGNDGVAARAPMDEAEEESMFVAGAYIGHFRATEKNDCDQFPDSCTGHIANYPCHWTSFVLQQAHHLGIALEGDGPSPNGGYSYDQLRQIWAAANATKSDVAMFWWSPEMLYEEYIGSEAQFTRVVLPPPTQECFDNRVSLEANCGDNYEEKIGIAKGACDTYSQPLKKLLSKGLREASTNKGLPEALWSPAYDVVSQLQMSSIQYGDVMQNWLARSTDPTYDPRVATCEWVVNHFDYVQTLIPHSYPRVVQEDEDSLSTATIAVASLAIVTVLVACYLTYLKRRKKMIYYTQVSFLSFMLCGQLLAAVGALLLGMPPSTGSCVVTSWLINLGFAIQLVPLVVRTFAINKLSSTGKLMQRVHLRTAQLLRTVVLAVVAVSVFLISWTVLDAPTSALEHELSGATTENGERVVLEAEYCGSDSTVWAITTLAWQGALLLPAAVMALVASRVSEDMNDTKSMCAVLMVHLLSVILQFGAFSFAENNTRYARGLEYASLIISFDTIASVLVYLVPKFVAEDESMETEILPDLFLNSTILVSDIIGFSGWSSVREPVQVFKFLETVYEEFDNVAEKHKVFKVETTGEYYTGLPEPREDHALVMARFADDCMKKMQHISKRLEILFGPDTGDLTLRIGLHSGPVTGGFMKGKQSRFQLFGDTMSTASVIHVSGEGNQIHVSQETATLLENGGKKKWVEPRCPKIQTKKGELQTYWLTRHNHKKGEGNDQDSTAGKDSSWMDMEEDVDDLDSEQRWIEWNVEVLQSILKKIIARRSDRHGSSEFVVNGEGNDVRIPLEEVQEVIELPKFNKDAERRQRENEDITVPSETLKQLRDYVTVIASMYTKNPFHNFAHASYVVMAVAKFMNRIIAASEMDLGLDGDRNRSSTQAAVHDHTYGITSDPLTQFACVFSALIHDVDHPGVPNPQLINENQRLATIYKSRSVAEQKSFDMAWDLLLDQRYDLLRSCICADRSELGRFRQLVINSVMATDLGDKELKALRNGRWTKAFDHTVAEETDRRVAINRKATIVIEHLIQAADVAHTCQHWTIYRKWNQRLFEECYVAYKEGRSDTNPADNWYEGEIGFFDFYIIPLSKKLRDCGVFGSTSDENLNYAQNNREMWVQEGQSIVEEMLNRLETRGTQVSEELSPKDAEDDHV